MRSYFEIGGSEGRNNYLTLPLFCAILGIMKITRIKQNCMECSKFFLAATKEIKRGNAKFCSRSCAAKHGNKQNALHAETFKCRWCAGEFQNTQSTSQYCSHRCKQRSANFRRKKPKASGIQELALLPCEVCGWDKAARDSHHIIPVKDGGENTAKNIVTLCPNCHRLAGRNLISQEQLTKIVLLRTISSSPCGEQDANVVIKET